MMQQDYVPIRLEAMGLSYNNNITLHMLVYFSWNTLLTRYNQTADNW